MGKQVKVRFNFESQDGASFSGESVWAEQVDQNKYRLLNIPFEAFGYAEGDIVRCERDELDEWDEVNEVVQDSGNRTIHLLFGSGADEEMQREVLSELVSVGCTYERASERFVAVTIPPTLEVPFSQLANYLNGLLDELLKGWDVAKIPSKLSS